MQRLDPSSAAAPQCRPLVPPLPLRAAGWNSQSNPAYQTYKLEKYIKQSTDLLLCKMDAMVGDLNTAGERCMLRMLHMLPMLCVPCTLRMGGPPGACRCPALPVPSRGCTSPGSPHAALCAPPLLLPAADQRMNDADLNKFNEGLQAVMDAFYERCGAMNVGPPGLGRMRQRHGPACARPRSCPGACKGLQRLASTVSSAPHPGRAPAFPPLMCSA